MGGPFESYSLYAPIGHYATITSNRTKKAMAEHALIYININSTTMGDQGHQVPICWTAVAAGNRDWAFHLWTAAILASGYTNFVFTFNHEPMWRSASQPKCSKKYDNPTTYKAAFSHVENLFRADGVDLPWAYVMTWGATKWDGGLLYRPAPRNFQVIGTDQYYRCNDQVYAPADAFKSFFDWTAKYAPTKLVLVGEIGALTTCPVRSLRWLQTGKERLLAHNVLAINWNLRKDADKEYNPLLQPDIRAWWLAWGADEAG
jgi:hypothetical protein